MATQKNLDVCIVGCFLALSACNNSPNSGPARPDAIPTPPSNPAAIVPSVDPRSVGRVAEIPYPPGTVPSGAGGYVSAIYSPDNTKLAIRFGKPGVDRGSLQDVQTVFYDVAEMRVLATIKHPHSDGSDPLLVQFSSDGNKAAIADAASKDNYEIKILDLKTGVVTDPFPEQFVLNSSLNVVFFQNDQKLYASNLALNGSIYDIASGRASEFQCKEQGRNPRLLKLGSEQVVISEDIANRALYICNLQGQVRSRIDFFKQIEYSEFPQLRFVPSPDGSRIAIAAGYGYSGEQKRATEFSIIDLENKKVLLNEVRKDSPSSYYTMQASADGSTLLVPRPDQSSFEFYDFRDGSKKGLLRDLDWGKLTYRLSPDGSKILLIRRSGLVPESFVQGEAYQLIDLNSPTFAPKALPVSLTISQYSHIDFSPDGKRILFASDVGIRNGDRSGSGTVLDLEGLKYFYLGADITGELAGSGFEPDGKMLVAGRHQWYRYDPAGQLLEKHDFPVDAIPSISSLSFFDASGTSFVIPNYETQHAMVISLKESKAAQFPNLVEAYPKKRVLLVPDSARQVIRVLDLGKSLEQ